MKREELARKLSEQSHISRAEARDQVDDVVRKILKSLRQGQAVELPGIGRLVSKAPAGKGRRSPPGTPRGGAGK